MSKKKKEHVLFDRMNRVKKKISFKEENSINKTKQPTSKEEWEYTQNILCPMKFDSIEKEIDMHSNVSIKKEIQSETIACVKK